MQMSTYRWLNKWSLSVKCHHPLCLAFFQVIPILSTASIYMKSLAVHLQLYTKPKSWWEDAKHPAFKLKLDNDPEKGSKQLLSDRRSSKTTVTFGTSFRRCHKTLLNPCYRTCVCVITSTSPRRLYLSTDQSLPKFGFGKEDLHCRTRL